MKEGLFAGIVLGSQAPWAESRLLHIGAKNLITVEYTRITTNHPRLITRHPDDIAAEFLNGTLETVDFVFSYSSLEHSGTLNCRCLHVSALTVHG
jgi:hypothetical protein